MKVIKQGKPKDEPVKQIECPNCKSELEYSNHDIVAMQNSVLGAVKRLILCPVCSNSIEVE